MRLWLADLRFCLAQAARVVGIALAAIAWASVLGSEAQLGTDLRALLTVVASVAAVLIAQAVTGLPPSARIDAIVRAWRQDIELAVRDVVGQDAGRRAELIPRCTALAIARIERTGRLPRDKRAWLRVIARLALAARP